MIEILGAGDRLHILNRSTAATASASWSQRIVGEMLEWAADAIGASLSVSIAVGGPATALSLCSVKTGGSRNACLASDDTLQESLTPPV